MTTRANEGLSRVTTDPVQFLQGHPFVLAPMAGITDHAFRSFMRRMGAGVVVTELVSAAGIEYGSERTLELMSFGEDQRPVGIQLFGDSPAQLAKAARLVEERGADFVDLNFGCPVPKVVKKGAGSAMLKDLPAMTQVLRAVKAAVKIPVTIKIRTGWDEAHRNADEVCQIAYDEGISWVAIHGRTRAQGYSGLADWEYIGGVKAKSKIKVLGNGDILTAAQAVDRLQRYNLDGVLIGRGALKNPFIFSQAMHLWKAPETLRETSFPSLKEPVSLANLGVQPTPDYASVILGLFEELKSRNQERITQIQLKKFSAWFASGFPMAAAFRKQIFQSETTDEILQTSLNYFTNLRTVQQMDTSQEAFLMGGHG